MSVRFWIGVHRQTDSFGVGEEGEGFSFVLGRFEGVFPETNDLIHGRSRIGEALLGAVAVDRGVVMTEESVLDLDLGGEDVRQKGED